MSIVLALDGHVPKHCAPPPHHSMSISRDVAEYPASQRSQKRSLQYYPDEIKHDLDAVDLTQEKKDEILTCAYQYTRCVIPEYSNSPRYFAFMRTIIIGTIAEFRGELVDVTAGDAMLGLDLGIILEELFGGTGIQCVGAYLYAAGRALLT